MRKVKIKVYGLVQGVSFRYYARAQAIKLNLVGWIKNCQDGNVYIEAEGLDDAINDFISWCKHGPPGASVKEIKYNFFPAAGRFKDFIIKI